MTEMLISFASHLFAWAVLAFTLSWFVAVTYPLLAHLLARCGANTASLLTLIVALTPLSAASFAIVLLAHPTVTFPLTMAHCHRSDCAPHTVHVPLDTFVGISTFTVTITLVVAALVYLFIQWFGQSRQLASLKALSSAGSPSYRVVETEELLAWCAGLIKPQIFLSRGLIEARSPAQISLILSHELAHVIRRDNLRRWLAHWATTVWPSGLKRKLRRDLAAYNEQACDLATYHQHPGFGHKQALISTLQMSNSEHRNQSTVDDIEKRLAALHRINAHNDQHLVLRECAAILSLCLVSTGSITLALYFGHPLVEILTK